MAGRSKNTTQRSVMATVCIEVGPATSTGSVRMSSPDELNTWWYT